MLGWRGYERIIKSMRKQSLEVIRTIIGNAQTPVSCIYFHKYMQEFNYLSLLGFLTCQ